MRGAHGRAIQHVTEKAMSKYEVKTCTIRVDCLDGNYYHSFGCTRSRNTWKSFRGAVRAARLKGFEVTNPTEDPMEQFRRDAKRTKIVTNLMSGKLVRIPVNTPACCDPSTETYWSK